VPLSERRIGQKDVGYRSIPILLATARSQSSPLSLETIQMLVGSAYNRSPVLSREPKQSKTRSILTANSSRQYATNTHSTLAAEVRDERKPRQKSEKTT
jgi:hypothetical protein